MNSADLPVTIAPAGERGWNIVRAAVTVAVLTSAPWAWLLNEERIVHERLLTEATARHARVEKLMIQYSNGVRANVIIQEETQ